MIFERKIMQNLVEWKESTAGAKALLIEGARRIGKSTIVEEFAKRNYKSYVIIDFAKASKTIRNAFDDYLNNLDSLFMVISVEYGVTLFQRDSLIIFDEVQKFPRAREAIKYLVKDGRYDFIETGSLISIRENVKDILIPSEERKITMYPMDFEEFCWAMGEKILCDYIKDCFNKKQPLLNDFHKKAMFIFMQYMIVGGMPKPVSDFIESQKQFQKCDEEKRDILNTYRDDIQKIKGKYRSKVLTIFDQIPGFLSSHEKRVKISSLGNGVSPDSLSFEDTFFWLSDSMVCNECFLCTDPNVGFSLNEKRSFVKCYMGDTGLLLSHAFDENQIVAEQIYSLILKGKLSFNKGMLYENIVAQMLTANGHKLYFYNHYDEGTKKNDIEIDFIISNKNKTNLKISPIEVKSSKNYHAISLGKFKNKFKDRIADSYVIHPKNFSIGEDGTIYLPVYMTFCL